MSSRQVHYVNEGGDTLMIGNGKHLAGVIDAETARIDAQIRLEEARLRTMKFEADRGDKAVQEVSAMTSALLQSLPDNPFAASPIADLIAQYGDGTHRGASAD